MKASEYKCNTGVILLVFLFSKWNVSQNLSSMSSKYSTMHDFRLDELPKSWAMPRKDNFKDIKFKHSHLILFSYRTKKVVFFPALATDNRPTLP